MAQKVLCVVIAPNILNEPINELEFPSVNKAIEEGYVITKMESMITQTGKDRVTLIFTMAN